MQVTHLLLIVSGLYLAGTYLYYRYAQRKGIAFRYKPIFLLIVLALFLLACLES